MLIVLVCHDFLPAPVLAPSFNSSEATDSSIRLVWYPIPCGSRGGNITGYKASLYRTGKSKQHRSITVTTESVTFDKLSPCTSYTVMIKSSPERHGHNLILDETITTKSSGMYNYIQCIHVFNPNGKN